MQEVETMVTEWEEVEVEEESIEYQWTDKLTTMDADKDGKVTIQEQQAWMVQQSPRVQQEMMRAMDSNQDGTVTVAEQQSWLARQAYNQSQKSPVLSQSVYSIQGQQPSQGFTTVTGPQSMSSTVWYLPAYSEGAGSFGHAKVAFSRKCRGFTTHEACQFWRQQQQTARVATQLSLYL